MRFGLAIGGVAAGILVGYVRLSGHEPARIVAAGLIGGLAGLVIAHRVQREQIAVTRGHIFEMLFVGAGVVLLVAGVFVDDLTITISAIPLWIVAAAMYVAKKRTTRAP